MLIMRGRFRAPSRSVAPSSGPRGTRGLRRSSRPLHPLPAMEPRGRASWPLGALLALLGRRVLLPHRSGNLVTLARLGIPSSSRSLRSSGLRCNGLSLAPEAGWVGLRGHERVVTLTGCHSRSTVRLARATNRLRSTRARGEPLRPTFDESQSALPLAGAGRGNVREEPRPQTFQRLDQHGEIA
jgi:hypothetical protein